MSEETTAAAPWRVSDAVITVVVGLAFASVVFVIVTPSEPDTGFTALQYFGVILVAQHVGVFGTVWYMSRRSSQPREPLGLRATAKDALGVLVGLVLAVTVAVGYWLVLELWPEAKQTQEVAQEAERAIAAGEWPVVVFTVVLLGPVAEEIVFRGVLLKALQNRHSERVAVWVSAGAFGAFHLLDTNAVFAVPALVLLGYVLARQTVGAQRLGMAIATHAGFNLFSVLVMMFS